MSYTYTTASRYFEDLRAQDVSSKLLIVPTSATIKIAGTGTNATLYTDATKTTTAANPVLTGQADNAAGISTAGNLLFFADAGDYDIVLASHTYTVSLPVTATDMQLIFAGVSGLSSIRDNGGSTYTQPVLNLQNLKAGKVVNNSGLSQVDVDLGDAQTFELGSTQTVNNNFVITSVASQADFAYSLVANRKYRFDGCFYFLSTNAAGVKVRIQGPNSSTTMRYTLVGPTFGQTSYTVTSMNRPAISVWNDAGQTFGGFDTTSFITCVQIVGGRMTTTSAGALDVRFCQAAGVATNTQLLAPDSYLTVLDIT